MTPQHATRALPFGLLLAASAAAPALGQEITGDYALEGLERGGERYRGSVTIDREGGELVLFSRFADPERTRPEARAARRPNPDGYWAFRFPEAGDDGAPGEGPGLVGGLAGERPADEEQADTWAAVTASELNLRAGPGTDHRILAPGLRGDRFPVLGRRDGWVRLRLPDGREVWGHGRYLDVGPAPAGGEPLLLVARRSHGLAARLRIDGVVVAQERMRRRPKELVFVAMGEWGYDEVKDLRQRGVDVVEVTDRLAPGDEDDHVRAGGRVYDLAEEEERTAYLERLGATPEQTEDLSSVIGEAGADARDEAGLLVRVLLEAERDERIVERLILSGHSIGDGVWGDGNGYLRMARIEEMLAALPAAAAQVEDFMIAGCYSSSPHDLARFRAMFPNLRTSWAYGDSAPGTWTGARRHNAIWERATRGHEYEGFTRNLARGERKAKNIATWNIVDGYMADGERRPVDEVRAELEETGSTYEAFFSGEREVESTQRGPLRDRYGLVQELLGNPGLPSDERAALERERDQTIRLIFYDARIKERFQSTYGERVAAGFQELGLEAPDFAQLSRAEALERIAAFESELEAAPDAPEELRDVRDLLADGLRDMDRSVIPTTWV